MHFETRLQKAYALLRMLKEKAITQTLVYKPDYKEIIHKIITKKEWRTEEYRQFLLDNEELIYSVFNGNPEPSETGHSYEKSHNLLTLTVALRSFFRIYYHLKKSGVEDISDYMVSFIAYVFCNNSGVLKDGEPDYEFTDEEIKILYPQFSAEKLFPTVRIWIVSGDFNKEQFYAEMNDYLKA